MFFFSASLRHWMLCRGLSQVNIPQLCCQNLVREMLLLDWKNKRDGSFTLATSFSNSFDFQPTLTCIKMFFDLFLPLVPSYFFSITSYWIAVWDSSNFKQCRLRAWMNCVSGMLDTELPAKVIFFPPLPFFFFFFSGWEKVTWVQKSGRYLNNQRIPGKWVRSLF